YDGTMVPTRRKPWLGCGSGGGRTPPAGRRSQAARTPCRASIDGARLRRERTGMKATRTTSWHAVVAATAAVASACGLPPSQGTRGGAGPEPLGDDGVVVNYRESSCAACLANMPGLIRLANENGSRVILISVRDTEPLYGRPALARGVKRPVPPYN